VDEVSGLEAPGKVEGGRDLLLKMGELSEIYVLKFMTS
jgi:hypothetical protein